jgi:hypothetical protein
VLVRSVRVVERDVDVEGSVWVDGGSSALLVDQLPVRTSSS